MLAVLVAFAVRYLLVSLFLPFSALDKVINFRATVGQASQTIPSRLIASLLIDGGFLLLAFGSSAAGVGHLLHRPLASSHPYEIVQGDER